MVELTRQQISRQDFVDNQIFELIQRLLPPTKRVAWDIEMIGTIRDEIRRQLVDKKLISEIQFYPFLKI